MANADDTFLEEDAPRDPTAPDNWLGILNLLEKANLALNAQAIAENVRVQSFLAESAIVMNNLAHAARPVRFP